MNIFKQVTTIIWLILALIGICIHDTDTIIFAMLWAIFIQVEKVSNKE